MIVIVPVDRGENIPRIMRMYEDQTTPCMLCLSPSLRVSERQLPGHDVFVTKPTKTIGAARNAGLEVARLCGSDFACFWDDDNYYGPRYVAEFYRYFRAGVNVVSRGLGFVRYDGELYRFTRPLGFFPGHSTAVRVRDAPNFPEASYFEDVKWSEPLIAAGRYSFLDPWHVVYNRDGAGHACPMSWAEFRKAFGPAQCLGKVPDETVNVPFDTGSMPTSEVSDDDVFESLEARLFAMRS